jgi:hypothetical protein
LYTGKIVLDKAEFIKLGLPFWYQYDEDKTNRLEKEEFNMVL